MAKSLSITISAVSCAVLLVACTGIWMRAGPQERLFFALQIEDGGRVLARPELLGETGKRVTLKLVDPDAPARSRLSLELEAERDRESYRVRLKLGLPDSDRAREGALELFHGEEKEIVLADPDPQRRLSVRLLLMRVDTPEFQTWLRLAREPLTTS